MAAKETTMTTTTRPRAAAVATLALTGALAVSPLLAVTAWADEPSGTAARTKAQIEHEERQATAGPMSKAQIEHQEMTAADATSGTSVSTSGAAAQSQPIGSSSSSGDAAAWQLAVSAALGAAVTGAAFVGARQVARHRTNSEAVAQ